MRSYRNHRTINVKEKEAAKEKNKRYILHRSKRGRYDLKCVDKNSWEYWEYSCSDGHPLSRKMAGNWPGSYRSFYDLASIQDFTGYTITAKRNFLPFSC